MYYTKSTKKKDSTYKTESKNNYVSNSDSCGDREPNVNSFYSISIFGELIQHELTDNFANQNQGKMIHGVVDC